MGKPSAPPPPDYAGAAQQTAAGNLEAARQTTAANRVNQITPQGTLNYSITGADPYGNPTWTAEQKYSPDQQAIYDKNTALSQGLLGTAEQGLGSVNQMLSNPTIDKSALPSQMVNAGETYLDAARGLMNPQWERKQSLLENQLANQGITRGSEAFNKELEQLGLQRSNADLQTTMGAIDKQGGEYQRQLSNQEYERMLPLNIVNALRTGNQVTGPNYVNSAQQPGVAGPDLLGAAQLTGQAQQNAYNQQVGSYNNMMGGLFGLGSAGIGIL